MKHARGRRRSSLFRGRAVVIALVAGHAVAAMGSSGCSRTAGAEATSEVIPAPAVPLGASAALERPSGVTAPSLSPSGDAHRGEKLVTEHQCNRCHEAVGPAAARESHCVNCHREILASTFPAPRFKLDTWKQNVLPFRAAPSLVNVGARLESEWVSAFLLNPEDVRPLLEPTMPRLGLTEADARDIAAYLTRESASSEPAPVFDATEDRLREGRFLLESRACGACHVLTGAPLPVTPSAESARAQDAVLLAPDLAHVRARFRFPALVSWLRDPRAIKPDTLMSPTGFDDAQARAVAAYLLRGKLEPAQRTAAFERLPVLDRPVSFAEVDAAVFRRTCRHCHGDPSVARGDGGPGNTGGFGFPARGIDFSSYRSIASGYRDPNGERRSLFEQTAAGTPRIVAALLARHEEECGAGAGPVRGMPLGLRALSAEQIQLVESWIAQGRPR